MKTPTRNVFIGLILTGGLVFGSGVAAHADGNYQTLGPIPTTDHGGSLTVGTHQFSNTSVGVGVDYSLGFATDTIETIKAVDTATGQTAATVQIDNSTHVYQREVDGLTLGHTYDFSAVMSWKDGSDSVSSPSVRQKLNYMTTITTLTWREMNTDVPENALGYYQRAQVSMTTRTDPTSLIAPSAPAAKASAIKTTKATITWKKAAARGGSKVTQYRLYLFKNGKLVSTKNFSASHARKVVLTHLKRNEFYSITLAAINQAKRYTPAVTYFFTK